MKTVRIVVRGQVQGVGYRMWLQREALTIGLDGWVRNRRDGSVEAVVAGEVHRIDLVLDAIRTGPPGARVDDVKLHGDATPPAQGFAILTTS